MKQPFGSSRDFAMPFSLAFGELFSMKNNIKFGDLRQLLLKLEFGEYPEPAQIVFRHKPSGTLFVFRPYRPSDPVASYNLIEVKDMLDARGLMSAETFENQFKKTPA